MHTKSKTYIVDIDDTICRTPKQDGKNIYDKAEPLQYRIDMINRLYDEGHTIIYWTARGSSSGIDHTDLTISQLDDWGVKYHQAKVGKPSYDVWIDDKAFNDEAFFDS